MSKKCTIVGATICSLAGLFTASASVTAYAAECLAVPNAQSRPGTRWHYRIVQATNQRCWYLKDLRGSSRSRSASESPATSDPSSRGTGSELALSAAPADSESSIRAWFSSTFAALALPSSTTETGKPSTSGPAVTRQRSDNERPELRKPQQSKSEQQVKLEESKSQREQGGSARAQDRFSTLVRILEAAGDKYVPNPTIDLAEDWQTSAIEAVGEKDVATPRTDFEEDWQRALYEEFLVWRTKQLMLQ